MACVKSSWHLKEPCPRVIRKRNREVARLQLARLMLLGNAIVPQAACHAFTVLHAALSGLLPGDSGGGRTTTRAICVVREGVTHILQRPDVPNVRQPRSRPVRVEWNGLQCTQQVWPTPIAQNWRQCRFLASRTCKTLVNQIFYDTATSEALGIETPRNMMSLEWMVNPAFVEYLMGYPQGYTAGAVKLLGAAAPLPGT